MPALAKAASLQTSEKKPRSSDIRAGRISRTPASAVGPTSSKADLAGPAAKVIGIFGLAEPVGALADLVRREIAELQSNLFQAHDLQALAALDRADVGRSVVEAVVRAGVEPGEAPSEPGDLEVAALQIGAVDVGDLQ